MPAARLQQQQQLLRQPAVAQDAAARMAAASPAGRQPAGTGTALPSDPWAQQQHALQPAAAPVSFEHWRGDQIAEHLCQRAEDIANSSQHDAMLRAFFAQYGAAAVSEAVEEQWLREYFPHATALTYSYDEGAAEGSAGEQHTQQHQQQVQPAGRAAAAAAAAATALQPNTRRSDRQRKEPDPLFAANASRFTAMQQHQQQQQQQQRQQHQQTANRQRPRSGRGT